MSFDNTKKIINGYAYFLNQRIGNGCSSEVYRGSNEKTSEQVAIKVVNKVAHKGSELIAMAEVEIKCLQLLRGSANILQIRHAIQTKNNIYIITELCERGTLAEILSRERKFDETKALECVAQIIQGFRTMVHNQIVHRDIKPTNIFVTRTNQLKIGDYGFAIQVEQCEEPQRQNVGSPLYMPPETLTENRYSFKSDIWAIGVIYLEMLTGKNPWKSKTEKDLAKELTSFRLQDLMPARIGAKSREFIAGCLAKRVEERMGPAELFAFDFTAVPEAPFKLQVPAVLKLKNTLSGFQAPVSKSSCDLNTLTPKAALLPAHSNLARSNANLLQVPQKSSSNVASSSKSSKKNSLLSSDNDENSRKRSDGSTYEECSIRVMEVDKKLMVPKQKEAPMNLLTVETGEKRRKKSMTDNTIDTTRSLIEMKEKVTKVKAVQSSMLSVSENYEEKDQKPVEEKDSMLIKALSCQESALDQKEQRKITAVERDILLQVQAQINYFRFMFKLFKKLKDILKTTDERIADFKGSLLHLITNKMMQIKCLKFVQGASKHQIKEFVVTSQYSNLLNVLKKYKQRYHKENETDYIATKPVGEKQFLNLMTHVMKILFQNIVKIELVEEELNRKKALVFILEDLIALSELYLMDKEDNWGSFLLKSRVSKLVESSPATTIDRTYWKEVKAKFMSLGSS